MRHLLLVACGLAVGLALAEPETASGRPLLGDYDAEPRRPDGHVDGEALLQRLQEMGANTYFWLIWHQGTDWEDLQAFLPQARQAGISVWVYLVPHSETAVSNPAFPYSEPFRLDYVRWAQEIAKLSLQHDNLPGYVIDDFAANMRPGRFTPEYIAQMVQAGQALNPKLRFCPLLYYREIKRHLVQTLAPLAQGVVAAYPQSREEVQEALGYLHDTYNEPGTLSVVFPTATASQAGDHGLLGQAAEVTDAARARLRFRYADDYDGPTTGYHVLQAQVNGQVVWEEDAGGRDAGEVDLDLSPAVAGQAQVRLAVGVVEKRGVAQYPLLATFRGLQVQGLKLAQPAFGPEAAWARDCTGGFTLEVTGAERGQGRWKLPLIIMPAGSRGEYAHRYEDDPTAENITRRVRMSLELVAAGQAEGCVLYCLNKTPGNEDLAAVARTYAAFWQDHPRAAPQPR